MSKKRIEELEGLIEYHAKHIDHIRTMAAKEEDREYRNDLSGRVERTHNMLAEWREELRKLRKVPHA